MNEVYAIIESPVLMLYCPNCKWQFPVKLPLFAKATKEGNYISCAACGSEFGVRVELLARAAELRNEAVDAGQICPECRGTGIGGEIGLPRRCGKCNGTGQI